MKRFIPLFFPLLCSAQCDLEILSFDPVVGEISVAFNSTQSCGGAAGPTGIAEIQFGFQALDEDCNAMNQGWDFPWGLSTSDESNHPGWIYSPTTTTQSSNWTNLDVWEDYDVDPPYYTGDTITFPLGDFYQANSSSLYSNLLNAFEFWMDQGLGIQAVIWQISYGPTMYADNGGWAEVGSLGDGITPDCCGLYEDSNWQDNWTIICPEDIPEAIYVCDTVYVDLPADTIYLLETDTIMEYDTALVNWYFYDTIYVELPPDTIPVAINWYFYDTTYVYITDTLVITDIETTYQTDTVYQTVIDTIVQYVSLPSDTIYTYQYDIVEVDCSTGQYCSTPFEDCSIYIPNSFTPDNDGVNDVWGAVTDSDCWISWRMMVISQSGEVIWQSFDSEEVWLGGDEYYVPSDVYLYRVECEGYGESYIVNGHVTIVR
jgi:hypothetical protein|tara:strand:+ start:2238 stop:3527 length:1290 start_codon:yes stop_codon:yes gene_type:complete